MAQRQATMLDAAVAMVITPVSGVKKKGGHYVGLLSESIFQIPELGA